MRPKNFPRRQRGVILVTAMLLLIVVTIMALSMFRGYGAQERLAGNTRDKQRALAAAISAQQYAEFQLASGAAPLPGVCPAGILPNGMQVCLPPPAPAPLPNFATLPWLTGVTYSVFTSNTINNVSNVISATGTRDTATQSASYVQAPVFNVIDLGPNAGTPAGEVYQVDAVGFGGTSNTVAVVESTFVIGSNTPSNLGNP
jgi:type IV pilus assembly protein PilX